MSAFKLTYEVYNLPLRHTFRISRGARTQAENVLIKVERDGIIGFGEAAPNYRYGEYQDTVITDLSKVEIEDFENIMGIVPFLNKQSLNSMAAKVGLEMALLDWYAKSHHAPLHQLMGVNDSTPTTSFTIGIDDLDVIKEKVLEAKDKPILKVKLGTDHDREIIKAIRSVSDQIIRVDANEGWKTLDQAKSEIEYLNSQNIELIEQPMPAEQIEDLKQLKIFSPIPLCADESYTTGDNLEELAEQFHAINIKLMKIGSVIKGLEQLNAIHELGMKVMIGCMIESSVAISAGALLGSVADYVDLDAHLLISDDPFEGLKMNSDFGIQLSDDSGLGVKPV